MGSKSTKTTKWIAIALSALALIGAVIKFGFMYDTGLDEKFVPKAVYQLQVEVIKEDVSDMKKKINRRSIRQQEDSRKLDRALVILENQ